MSQFITTAEATDIISCINKHNLSITQYIESSKQNTNFADSTNTIIPVGSYRRGLPTHKDIDLLTLLPIETIISAIKSCYNVKKILAQGEKKCSLVIALNNNDVQIDLFYTTLDNLPFALFHYTGSKKFNIRTRRLAKIKGYKLNQYGLFRMVDKGKMDEDKMAKTGKKIKTERDIFDILGVTWKEPHERNE